MTEGKYDLIVVGGGPGGYVAAIRAAQLGMRTALVEREHLGGICLNWGCIPTKALLRASEIFHLLQRLDEFGIAARDIRFDVTKVVARSRSVADQLNRGVAGLLKKNKVTVYDGVGAIAGRGRIRVRKGERDIGLLQAEHIVLATGARARTLPTLQPDGERIWTYKEAMIPQQMPRSVLIVGSGAIGIEFASFYRALGAEVAVVEIVDRILPSEDEEISAFARKAFEKQGMKIDTGTEVTSAKTKGDGVTVTLARADKRWEVEVDRVILAVGIVGNTEGIGLEQTKAKVERGHLVVDRWLATSETGLYAIGDLVGPPWLAHKASHEGIICVEKIAGVADVHPLDVRKIPACTYCAPQIASLGMSERAAKEAGYQVKVGRFPFLGNGKAIALGEPEGFIKTIFDAASGALLGAHMIGVEVTELIQGFSMAMVLETTETELMHAIFPHPTLSEAMHESVLAAYGRGIHY
jgi:dihydrolipoamide dehydrogenase